ncbi:hypothetical protein L211DRAFT_843308 [Terfezia boudieri ATCC MYA-4762]|uniref:Uncharacterized protein n=1 Tax=Terfezia boudieri ATCC MYA-4762 TaxID=1051890 RepID=A0A3N4L744_9PEZI|nr:hypothetical protein L211DRAFT_843308 [Terfezia boudieri ATCC MYA-4762]
MERISWEVEKMMQLLRAQNKQAFDELHTEIEMMEMENKDEQEEEMEQKQFTQERRELRLCFRNVTPVPLIANSYTSQRLDSDSDMHGNDFDYYFNEDKHQIDIDGGDEYELELKEEVYVQDIDALW